MPKLPGMMWLEVPALPPLAPDVVVWIDTQGRCWLAFPTLVYCWLCVWRYGDAEWAEDVFWQVA